MTLVPCLYTGPPAELEHPDTGRMVPLTPNESTFPVPQHVADTHPYWHPVEKPAKTAAKGDG